MHDRWEYTIPADTAEADAVKVPCKISPGALVGLRVYHPRGCRDLVRSRIMLGEKPIAPRSAKHFLAGEGFVCDMRNVWEPIKEDLPVLNWTLWNTDDTFPHTPWIDAEWISSDEPYALMTYRVVYELVNILKKVLGL